MRMTLLLSMACLMAAATDAFSTPQSHTRMMTNLFGGYNHRSGSNPENYAGGGVRAGRYRSEYNDNNDNAMDSYGRRRYERNDFEGYQPLTGVMPDEGGSWKPRRLPKYGESFDHFSQVNGNDLMNPRQQGGPFYAPSAMPRRGFPEHAFSNDPDGWEGKSRVASRDDLRVHNPTWNLVNGQEVMNQSVRHSNNSSDRKFRRMENDNRNAMGMPPPLGSDVVEGGEDIMPRSTSLRNGPSYAGSDNNNYMMRGPPSAPELYDSGAGADWNPDGSRRRPQSDYFVPPPPQQPWNGVNQNEVMNRQNKHSSWSMNDNIWDKPQQRPHQQSRAPVTESTWGSQKRHNLPPAAPGLAPDQQDVTERTKQATHHKSVKANNNNNVSRNSFGNQPDFWQYPPSGPTSTQRLTAPPRAAAAAAAAAGSSTNSPPQPPRTPPPTPPTLGATLPSLNASGGSPPQPAAAASSSTMAISNPAGGGGASNSNLSPDGGTLGDIMTDNRHVTNGLITSAQDSLAKSFGITNPLDRLLVTANGNLQRLLSSYYDSPVTVQVEYCRPRPPQGPGQPPSMVWDRQVSLEVLGEAVCVATSTVQIHSPECWHLVESGQVGLGQLFRYWDILPEFQLHAAGYSQHRPGECWRTYTLRHDKLMTCEIQEVFAPNIWKLSGSSSSSSSNQG